VAELILKSTLPVKYREELEELLFFHPQQAKVQDGIVYSIEKYGTPQIVEKDHQIHIELDQFPGAQTLYAFDRINNTEKLIGSLIYYRTNPETIEVVHIDIQEKYTLTGPLANKQVMLWLILNLRKIARMIKGVRYIQLSYSNDHSRTIPV
jgi:hypothetical protein